MVGAISGYKSPDFTFDVANEALFAQAIQSSTRVPDPGTDEQAAWPPKGSTPYSGRELYYPTGQPVPVDRLAQMPDGSVYYRSSGTESLRTLTLMANDLGNHGLSIERFKAINQLPIVVADDTPAFKKDQSVLIREKTPQAARAPETQRYPITESPRDHDRYIAEDMRKARTATEMKLVEGDVLNYYQSDLAKSAEADLVRQFGKPYVETMKQKWADEQLAVVQKRQGTIDIPWEEKQARERDRFMKSLDDDFGAFSPVMKFFLPTYAMPDMGFAPSPIEIITDFGMGAHFSPKPARMSGYRRGNETMAKVEFDKNTIYFVPEPQRMTSTKPGNVAEFNEIRTPGGQPLWLPKNSVRVTPETAQRLTEWVTPAVEGSKTSKSTATTAGKSRSDGGSAPQSEARQTAPNRASSEPPKTAAKPTPQPATAKPEERPAVMTSTGVVKDVEAVKPSPAPAPNRSTPADGTARPNITNALQPGDPALDGMNRLKQIISKPVETGGNDGKVFEKPDGTGINRSVSEPNKVIFSTNAPVNAAQVKEAFGRDVDFTIAKTGSNYVVKLDIPHTAPKTGAKNSGPKEVDPRIALSEMNPTDVNGWNMDEVSTPRGRVLDPVNAENALEGQPGTHGVQAVDYHLKFAKARGVAADGLERSASRGGLYYSKPEDMVRTFDQMNRTMARTEEAGKSVTPGEMRHPKRLIFGPAPVSHVADVEVIAKKYGEPFHLADNPREGGKKTTPAMTPEQWARYNPGLPFDAELVNPKYENGANWQYAGTKSAKPGEPDYARQVQYEKAVVETYQKVAFEKGTAAMEQLTARNNINPAENKAGYDKANRAMLETLGEHAYYLLNARKYDNSNASVYMNEVNMLLRMAGLEEVPHGVLDHCAYRFSPEGFKRYFADWVTQNQ